MIKDSVMWQIVQELIGAIAFQEKEWFGVRAR